ncbi:MAG: hypothetical protein ACRCUQ_00060 [Alphaproteobacteria bacterium]
MKRVYNTGSYLKLSLCMLSLTGFSGDLSARSLSSYGQSAFEHSKDFSAAAVSKLKQAWSSSEKLSEVKDALWAIPKKGVSVRSLSERVKSRFRKNQPTWTTLQALASAREESEGALGSLRGNKFKKNHVRRLGRMASLKKIEGVDNPYRLSIAECLARSGSRKAQTEGEKILWKIAKKPTHLKQQAAIQLLLESGDDKLVKKGHKAQQTILNQPNDTRFVDVSIDYFKWASKFPEAQEQASANLKQLLITPGTSPEVFQRIMKEVKDYKVDFRKFIHEQFAGETPHCAEVLKDNSKNSVMRDFLEKEKAKEDFSRDGGSIFRTASDSFVNKISNDLNLYPNLWPSAPGRDPRYDTEITEL